MSILNFDGPSGRNFGKPFRVILGIGALAAVVAVASTLAANININSGPVEFGQGVAQTTACDDSITVTPRTQFLNSNDSDTVGSQVVTVGPVNEDAFIIRVEDRNLFYIGMPIVFEGNDVLTNDPTEVVSIETDTISSDMGYPYFADVTEVYVIVVASDIFDAPIETTARVGGSGFQFSGVEVRDIDATEGNCRGKTFTLKAYGDTETAALATYSVFVGENGFLSGDGSIESFNPGTSSSGFSLTFSALTVSANSVYKITIESSEYAQTLLEGRTLDASHIGIGVEALFEETPTVLMPICENGTCTATYQRPSFIDMGGSYIELTLARNLAGDADTSWMVTVSNDGPDDFAVYGYIKYFNGTYGVFFITEDESGPSSVEEQGPITFSTAGQLPVNVSGEPEGTLTWSYPSESRYTE
jgi:hypothetical protein